MLNKLIRVFALIVMMTYASTASAQHEGDVEFEYHGGNIEVEGGELSLLFANRIFDGAFPVGGFFDRFTSDPGFEAHLPIGPNDIIGFDLHAGHHGHFLNFYDPTANQIVSAHPWSINIDWGVGNLDVSATTGGTGLIGQAESDGVFHVHPNFRLSAGTPIGAYGFLMSLNSSDPGIGDSDPFWLVFNFGMDAEDFELATRSFTGIPEPSSIGLIGAGLVGLVTVGRRRRTA